MYSLNLKYVLVSKGHTEGVILCPSMGKWEEFATRRNAVEVEKLLPPSDH